VELASEVDLVCSLVLGCDFCLLFPSVLLLVLRREWHWPLKCGERKPSGTCWPGLMYSTAINAEVMAWRDSSIHYLLLSETLEVFHVQYCHQLCTWNCCDSVVTCFTLLQFSWCHIEMECFHRVFVYPLHWIYPQISFFPSVSQSVCLWTDRLSKITSTILNRFSRNFACSSEMWSLRRLLFVRQTGSSLPILEVCGFQFW